MCVDFDKIIYEVLEIPERDDLSKEELRVRCDNAALAIRAMRDAGETIERQRDGLLEQLAMAL